MIDIATTPGPAAMPGGQGGGASRDAAGGFADLVARPGPVRAASSASGATDATPDATDDAEMPTGDREAGAQGNEDGPADGEVSPPWPVRSLHKVLASLLGGRASPADRGDGPSANPVPGSAGETEVVAEEAAKPDEEAAVEAEDGTGEDTDDVDAGAAASAAAMAVAIILPPQPRDQRPAGAGAARPAEQTASAQPAAPAAAPPEEEAGQDGQPSHDERRGEAASDAGNRRSPAPETGDMKVRVIAETVAPAPGPSQNSRTVADLAAAVASDDGWKGAMERAAASRADAANAPAGPVRDLRIQLNPAELGSVDARLRIVGEQLSVEIRVESGEAFRRLSSEKDAILTALRGLGFAVDDVSIQQQPAASAQVQASPGGRQGDPSGGLSQGAGRGHQGDGGASGGRPRGEEQGGQNRDARTPATRPAGGGLYI
jgi:chemotaxis protein MotD